MFWVRLLQFGMIISQHGWTLNGKEYDDDICGFCSCTSGRSLVICRNKNLIAAPHFKPGYVNPKVKYYWLDHNSIDNINSSDFQQFPNLILLGLQNNKISNLPPEVFSNLSKLEILLVEGNQINVIPLAVYEKLPRLWWLSTSSFIDCCNAYGLNQGNTSFECGKTWLTTTKPPFNGCAGWKLIPEGNVKNGWNERHSVGKLQLNDSIGKWKYFHDENWTKADADVACKELGFPEAIESLLLDPPFSNIPSESVLCKNYQCNGYEEYMLKCKEGLSVSTNCKKMKIAGVRCKDEGKRLCTVCNCSKSSVDCSNRNLRYMPWTKSNFGRNMTRDFSYNSILEVEENLLETSGNLTHLNMSHNRIAELPPNLFDGITRLAYMNLAYNKIKSIPGELFHGLTDLAHVDFSVNSISDLQNNLLKSSKYLTYLDFSVNSISDLQNNLLKSSKNLTYLNLAKNNIEKIPDKFFRNFTQLKLLYVS